MCLLYLGQFDRIIIETNNWQSDPNWAVMMGTYRASAFKRRVELNRSFSERENAFSEVVNIFNEIFKNENYPSLACIEANKMLKDINIGVSDRELNSNSFWYNFVEFIADHFYNITLNLRGQSIDSDENQSFSKKLYEITFQGVQNQLSISRWYTHRKEISYDNEHIQELIDEGYTIVTVYNLPEGNFGMSSYMFAKDNNETQFYLNVENFESGWTR